MREEEFEKRVRDKMKQLGFDPSESVWIGVDKEINKEKKRRMPLFWLFFASGIWNWVRSSRAREEPYAPVSRTNSTGTPLTRAAR